MHFSKMHGLKNDFLIVDSITQNINLTPNKIKYLSNRYHGIGFDQLLIIEPPYDPDIDFHCRIYNSDGTEVNQCGNGIRCCAQFVHIKKLTKKNNIKISTKNSHMKLSIINKNFISLNIGEPIFTPNQIPFYTQKYQKNYILFLPTQVLLCSIVSVGNPHCVILVKSVKTEPVKKLGKQFEEHHRFPEQVNVSFMEIIDRKNIKIRIYERNVGETQSCGSASCAAVATGIQQGILHEKVSVQQPGGILSVFWKGKGHKLYITGPAIHVYDGFIQL